MVFKGENRNPRKNKGNLEISLIVSKAIKIPILQKKNFSWLDDNLRNENSLPGEIAKVE
jgi:hypothetical protein